MSLSNYTKQQKVTHTNLHITYNIFVEIAHEARVLDVFSLHGEFLSQLRKRVQNDTENHIEQNGRDDKEERHVEEELYDQVRSVVDLHAGGHVLTDTTAQAQTVVHCAEVAVQKRCAN